jgi:hypothetical protein
MHFPRKKVVFFICISTLAYLLARVKNRESASGLLADVEVAQEDHTEPINQFPSLVEEKNYIEQLKRELSDLVKLHDPRQYYKIGHELGSGNRGTVFKCFRRSDGKIVPQHISYLPPTVIFKIILVCH